MQARSKRRCKQKACDPCPLVFQTAHRALYYQRLPPSEMRKAINKAKNKVKKTAGRVADQFRPSQPGTREVSPSRQSEHSTTPDYARPPPSATVLATTGSAVKVLLVAARDGSDLFLPLKAALVGIVALWDVFDVRHSTLLRSDAYSACSVLSKPRSSSRGLKANSWRSKPLLKLIRPSRARSTRAYRHASSH